MPDSPLSAHGATLMVECCDFGWQRSCDDVFCSVAVGIDLASPSVFASFAG